MYFHLPLIQSIDKLVGVVVQ